MCVCGYERRTTIVARELDRHGIDIAAPSETRCAGSTQFEEVGAGYTFFCTGQPGGEMRQRGVGFAIRSTVVKSLKATPHGTSPRLMTLQLNVEGGRTATILSCYAPTLAAAQDEKDVFYSQLTRAVATVPHSHKLFVLGDFNARVGRDHELWTKVMGSHGVRNGNSSGSMLL